MSVPPTRLCWRVMQHQNCDRSIRVVCRDQVPWKTEGPPCIISKFTDCQCKGPNVALLHWSFPRGFIIQKIFCLCFRMLVTRSSSMPMCNLSWLRQLCVCLYTKQLFYQKGFAPKALTPEDPYSTSLSHQKHFTNPFSPLPLPRE